MPFYALFILIPLLTGPSLEEKLDLSIKRGAEYLITNQNKDGSWGSHISRGTYNIMASVPGSHKAFKVATSGLCLMALQSIPDGERGETHKKAIGLGLDYMIRNARVKRANGVEMYNVWAFAYGLQSLSMMMPHIKDPKMRQSAEATAKAIIEALEVYQVPDGGWGYFDFDYKAYRPAGTSMSFTTAAILVGLHEAKKAGFKIPEKMLGDAQLSLRRARKADGSYIYGDYLKYLPNMGVNQVKGSISRSAACHMGQFYFGGKVSKEDLKLALTQLLKHQRFADIGRKRPIPHEAWYGTSGYFFLFGQYYSSLAMKELAPKDQQLLIPQYAKILLKLQEPDGSWWDYLLYRYHKPYGTGYALMSLCNLREILRQSK